MQPVFLLADFATLSKTLGDMWQTVPEKEKMVYILFAICELIFGGLIHVYKQYDVRYSCTFHCRNLLQLTDITCIYDSEDFIPRVVLSIQELYTHSVIVTFG